MPVLETHHDLAHPVEGDAAWSESYYFNAFDPGSDSGFFTRIGIRPNEGSMDVSMSAWLPGGELAEYRASRAQTEMVDTVLDVGAARYQMLEPMRAWRISMDAESTARACAGSGVGGPGRAIPVALDVRFEALTPGIGTDGQGPGGTKSDEAAAASATVGKGHLEQAGRWTGWFEVDGRRHHWDGALGNRDRSWGPRRWGGPRMWRWFSINVGETVHFGGIRLGTGAGDLHRGWVWDGGRATSVSEWRLRTELADDGLTQRVVHLEVVDKAGHTHVLRGDVQRVAGIGRMAGTLVNEGLTRWTYLDGPAGPGVGYGISEYLHQLDDSGKPVVAIE
ncbi:MAG TPA: hypothetical protein VG032_04100 [Acidimicrobiales bacterium]|jgi:hypothetical protein|nr:hypothetical protein [Acidimicrobiales bacterium]